MARVTVEDCMSVVENRFELVIVAARRAKDIAAGTPLTVNRDNDKNPVVALREIGAQTVDAAVLKDKVIQNLQKLGKFDKLENEVAFGDSEEDQSELLKEMEVYSDDVSSFDEDDLSMEEGEGADFAEDNMDDLED